jgi:hypothetical protein
MEVGTEPLRWKFLSPENGPSAAKDRSDRAVKTNVARLDFYSDGSIQRNNFKTAAALQSGLDELDAAAGVPPIDVQPPVAESTDGAGGAPATGDTPDADAKKIQFRLFVVEDLSRSVIESLGSKFDIDPSFFREHINDYAWYNVRDRFAEAPNLQIIAERQQWLQVRWARARYFRTNASFEKAKLQAGGFNILRRPDPDMSNGALLDDPDAIVALSRTRASFWRGAFDGMDIGEL